MGLFLPRSIEQKILNEIEIKNAQGDTIGGTEKEPLADDANKDTNDGFGTDPDSGYANRGGDGGGSSEEPDDTPDEEPTSDENTEEEPTGEDDGGDGTIGDVGDDDYTVPDEEEPVSDDDESEEPVGDEEGMDDSEEPISDGEDDGGDGTIGDVGDDRTADSGDATGSSGSSSEDSGEEPMGDDSVDDEEPTDGEEGDDSEGEEDGGAETDKSIDDQMKEVEKELFANINADQMKEKIYRLKKDYIDLYETIVKLGEDLIKIPRNSNTQIVLDFLNKKVSELKELVSYNMLHNFDNKTYIENTITYQECLAALNSISSILEELESTYNVEEDEEDSDKDDE